MIISPGMGWPAAFAIAAIALAIAWVLVASGDQSIVEFDGDDDEALRDEFAARAMQAVPMPQGHMHDIPAAYQRIAEHAYKMADAMLEARQS